MRTVAIVQIRMGSTRLPKKNGPDFKLCGKPLTWHVLDRIKRSCCKDIIAAIPYEKDKDELLDAIGGSVATIVIPGNPADVVRRYFMVGAQVGADIVIRIPGDNPCIDPDEIDRMIATYNEDPSRWNWLTTNLDRNVLGNGYPGGLGCEIYDFRFIKWMHEHLTDKRHREHPHLWSFEQQRIRTIQAPETIRRPELDFSVNTYADFEFIERIYKGLYPGNHHFTASDAIAWLDANPNR